MRKNISRKLVKEFISREKLRTIPAFLEYLRLSKNMKVFVDYIQKHTRKTYMIEDSQSHILFHGSRNLYEKLSASRKEKLIYATSDPSYAIFLAILDLKNATAGVLMNNGKAHLTVDLSFVNGPSSFKSGWVHIISARSFRKIKNKEYVSKQPATVIFSIPVTPNDLTVSVNIQF